MNQVNTVPGLFRTGNKCLSVNKDLRKYENPGNAIPETCCLKNRFVPVVQ